MPFKQVLLPLIFICTLGAQAQTSHAPDPDTKISALDAPLFYQLLVGELSARSEEPGTAFSLILDAARKTNDPLVFRRSVQIALQARSGESALAAAQAWSLAIPSSKEANRFVLQILLGLNRIADTIKPLQRELTLTPAKEQRDLIWSIPGIYERVKDKQIAASIVQKALTGQTANAQLGATAWSSIGRMWLSAGDKTAALSAATKGLALDPQSEHPALLALSMMSPDGPQAERLVKVHLPTARPEFLMAYVKTLLSAQREGDATAQLKIIQSRFPSYADAWLIDGALALQTGQSSLAEKHLQRYLELDDATPAKDQQQEAKRGRAQAFFSMAQIAQQRKDLPQAIAWLQRVDNPDDMVRAQVRKAMLIAQLGRVDEAIDLIHAQSARSEADAQLKRSAEIQVLREKKLFERARDTLTVFTTQNPDDLDLVYDLAMVYEKLGNLVEMESLLRRLMVSRPQDPHAYNALGYSLAERNLRLPEAILFITKALELKPKDPLITDSLAWAEFRSGHFETALSLLESAFKVKPDPEIAAHLGEVLWTMQRRQDAVEAFKEGLKLNADNETLTETIQRLHVPL